MNVKWILSNKLKILKISSVYGGVLSFITVALYLFALITSTGSFRYFQVQAILLPLGVISVSIFSYLHLSFKKITSEEFTCDLLPCSLISLLCIVPGMILTFFGLKFLSNVIFPPFLIILIIGIPGLVFGFLSIYIVLKGEKKVQEGLKTWKANGLRLSTFILIAGVLIAGFSIVSGPVSNSKMMYSVMVDASGTTTLFIPVPVDMSNNIVDVINDLTLVEGNAEWKAADTLHGKALQVDTVGKCILYAEKEYDGKTWEEGDEWLNNYSISMTGKVNADVYEVWVFTSNDNTTLKYKLELDDGWNNYLRYTGTTRLNKGWQIVELEKNLLFYD